MWRFGRHENWQMWELGGVETCGHEAWQVWGLGGHENWQMWELDGCGGWAGVRLGRYENLAGMETSRREAWQI